MSTYTRTMAKRQTSTNHERYVGRNDNETSSSPKTNHGRKLENIHLIWLDTNIDKESDECRRTKNAFEQVVDDIDVFNDSDQCIRRIVGLQSKNVHLVISGSLGQKLVPRLHDVSQIDSIFVFCGDKNRHEQWAKAWRKIKGVYTDAKDICNALRQNTNEPTASGTSNKTPTVDVDDNLSFVYTTIIKEILLSITFEDNDIEQFIDFCRRQYSVKEEELKSIEQFTRKYREQNAVRRFNISHFLRQMVNGALQAMDMNGLIRMGFLLQDLHRQIEHYRDYSDIEFTVYHAETISRTKFEQMMKRRNDSLLFNKFLLTNKNRQTCLDSHRPCPSDRINVLYIMKINPAKSSVPFASIKQSSASLDNKEILFSTHTAFCIDDIRGKSDAASNLVEIDLTLMNAPPDDVRTQIDDLRREINQIARGWSQVVYLMTKLRDYDQVERTYRFILKRMSDEIEKGDIYHRLGLNAVKQENYGMALEYYKKAEELWKTNLPEDHSRLAALFNDIASVHDTMKRSAEAATYYLRTLEIYQKIRPPNHPDLISAYDNMAGIRNKLKNYTDALQHYENALEIRQRTLPKDHPDLAISYNNIGSVYRNMGNSSQAISAYQHAVEIGQRALSPNDSALRTYKENLDAAKKRS